LLELASVDFAISFASAAKIKHLMRCAPRRQERTPRYS
jgi:hypothetical protein